MTIPCKQGERLATLETTSKQTVRILDELKKICGDTYSVLSLFAGQGEQIKSLVTTTDKIELDIERAWVEIRAIKDRHNVEAGEDIADKRWKKNLIWCVEKGSVPVLMTLLFAFWLNDHFHFVQLWYKFKEFNG